MKAADLGPVADGQRTQAPLDLFLIFAGANVVATTLQVGASLSGVLPRGAAFGVIAAGCVLGAALVAALVPTGTRLGVPSIVAVRAVLGLRGAGVVALVLFATNFAWIALNNVIAASVSAHALGAGDRARVFSLLLGLAATAIVAVGPSAVGRADRVAVPAMGLAGVLVTIAVLRAPWPVEAELALASHGGWWRGLDIVVGYQVSWLLMFADYPRYSRSPRRSGVAVFLGLLAAALWFMPLGLVTAQLAGSADPGAMIGVTGLGGWGALLVALATVTTNFVNIYMSSLALKSLWPSAPDRASVWAIGGLGTLLGLFSGVWLERFGDFMMVIGGSLAPVGGLLLAEFVLLGRRPEVAALYAADGPFARHGGFLVPGVLAWAAGSLTYYLAAPSGATLPTLAVTVATYLAARRGLPPWRASLP
jgi:NCS1 family nucleobase:cation symporter-1